MKRLALSSACFLVSLLSLLTLPAPCQAQELMSVRVAATDLAGNPIRTIQPNSPFLLNLYAADIRPAARGVFSVYADVFYNAGLFAATPTLTFTDEFSVVKKGDGSNPGIFDEAGAVWNYGDFPNEPNGGEYLVLSTVMVSLQQIGTGAFTADPADSILNDYALFGLFEELLSSQVRFLGSLLTVTTSNGLICDADSDGDCDIADLDLLYAAFGSASPELDLNGSGTVESGDIPEWLSLASDPSNTAKLDAAHVYLNGDANLDGSVNSLDLGILLNVFNDTSGLGYASGNLNDDADVNSLDLGIVLNNFNHTSLAALAVPEPRSQPFLLVSLVGWVCLRRRGRPQPARFSLRRQ